MKKFFSGTITIILLLIPAFVFADVLTSNEYFDNIDIFSSGNRSQTIECVEGSTVDSIKIYVGGSNGLNEILTMEFNGIVSNETQDNMPTVPDFYTFTFTGASCISGANTILLYMQGVGNITWRGSATDTYPQGQSSFSPTADYYFLVNGTEPPPFVPIGTGIYFFGETAPVDNASGQTANALGGNLGVNLGSVWQVVLLALSVPLAFVILQRVIMLFGYAYYGDYPKKKDKILTSKKRKN